MFMVPSSDAEGTGVGQGLRRGRAGGADGAA